MLKKIVLCLTLITSQPISSMHDFALDEIKEKKEKVSQEDNFANDRQIYKNSIIEKTLLPYLYNRDLTDIVCDYLNNFDNWEITKHFNLPLNQRYSWYIYSYNKIKYLSNNKLIISSDICICIYDLNTKKIKFINDCRVGRDNYYHDQLVKYCILINNKIVVYSSAGMIRILNNNHEDLQYEHTAMPSDHTELYYAESLPNGNLVTYFEIMHHQIIKKTWDTSSELPKEVKKPLPIKCLSTIEINFDSKNNDIDYNKKFQITGTKKEPILIIWPNKKNDSYEVRLPKILENQYADSLFCFFNNDDNFAVFAQDKKTIKIINTKLGELIKIINLPDKFIYASICAFSSNSLAVLYHKTVEGQLKVAIISDPLFEKEKIKKEGLKNKIINFFKKLKK